MPDKNSFNDMTDEEIVFLAQKGCCDALDYIILKYRPKAEIKVTSYYLVGGDRDDLIQEGLIGLFNAILSYKKDKASSFRTFAELCIERRIYSAIKSAHRKKHLPLNSYVSLDKPNKDDNYDSPLSNIVAVDSGANPEEIVINRESMIQMNSKLAEVLSPFECKVLSLYLKGKTYNEIAVCLSKEPKSIDNALQRIKKKWEKLSD